MDAAPVIARGHNVAALVPPIPEAALPYLNAVSGRRRLVLVAEAQRAMELAEAAGGLAVTGLERAAKRLASSSPDPVIASTSDALSLLKRSALRPAAFGCVVLAWPEQLEEGGVAALESVMAECDKEAQRIVLTAEEGPGAEQIVERYAFKAMTYGFPAAAGAVGAARYVIASAARFAEARRRVLDVLAPESDESVTVALCPESRERAAGLVETAGPTPPVLVLEPHQLPWARRWFEPLAPLPLPGLPAAERRVEAIRDRLARLIEGGELDKELMVIAPLLARYDAAHLAAAALRLGEPGAGPAAPAAPAWARLWVGVGKRDGARPGDLVGAIVGEAKVPPDVIGRIEVRELFSLVDVRGDQAEAVARSLTGSTLRGRRVVARLDKGRRTH